MMTFLWGLIIGGILGLFANNLFDWALTHKAKPPSPETRKILKQLKEQKYGR
jgi:hypothetical protein